MAAVPKKVAHVGAMLQTDSVLDVIRRELRRVSPDVRIDSAQIKAVLVNEVIKREVLEGGKADEAKKKIAKTASRALKAKAAIKPERATVREASEAASS